MMPRQVFCQEFFDGLAKQGKWLALLGIVNDDTANNGQRSLAAEAVGKIVFSKPGSKALALHSLRRVLTNPAIHDLVKEGAVYAIVPSFGKIGRDMLRELRFSDQLDDVVRECLEDHDLVDDLQKKVKNKPPSESTDSKQEEKEMTTGAHWEMVRWAETGEIPAALKEQLEKIRETLPVSLIPFPSILGKIPVCSFCEDIKDNNDDLKKELSDSQNELYRVKDTLAEARRKIAALHLKSGGPITSDNLLFFLENKEKGKKVFSFGRKDGSTLVASNGTSQWETWRAFIDAMIIHTTPESLEKIKDLLDVLRVMCPPWTGVIQAVEAEKMRARARAEKTKSLSEMDKTGDLRLSDSWEAKTKVNEGTLLFGFERKGLPHTPHMAFRTSDGKVLWDSWSDFSKSLLNACSTRQEEQTNNQLLPILFKLLPEWVDKTNRARMTGWSFQEKPTATYSFGFSQDGEHLKANGTQWWKTWDDFKEDVWPGNPPESQLHDLLSSLASKYIPGVPK